MACAGAAGAATAGSATTPESVSTSGAPATLAGASAGPPSADSASSGVQTGHGAKPSSWACASGIDSSCSPARVEQPWRWNSGWPSATQTTCASSVATAGDAVSVTSSTLAKETVASAGDDGTAAGSALGSAGALEVTVGGVQSEHGVKPSSIACASGIASVLSLLTVAHSLRW